MTKNNANFMIYAYIRVSSDKQSVENQRFEIQQYCDHFGLSIDKWIEETVSGTIPFHKRSLGKLLHKINQDDLIIISELSRLGRNLFMIFEVLSFCVKSKCKLYSIKDNFKLQDSIETKVLAFAFGLSSEIERNLISLRTREALARKKAEGKLLGRPRGSKPRPELHPLYGKEKYVQQMLESGVPKTKICRILHCSRSTIYRYLQINSSN